MKLEAKGTSWSPVLTAHALHLLKIPSCTTHSLKSTKTMFAQKEMHWKVVTSLLFAPTRDILEMLPPDSYIMEDRWGCLPKWHNSLILYVNMIHNSYCLAISSFCLATVIGNEVYFQSNFMKTFSLHILMFLTLKPFPVWPPLCSPVYRPTSESILTKSSFSECPTTYKHINCPPSQCSCWEERPLEVKVKVQRRHSDNNYLSMSKATQSNPYLMVWRGWLP